MSDQARSISEAVQRLSCRDSTLKEINLVLSQLLDSELAELVDCLLAHPDVATRLFLGRNQLTDETGVKLARYLAASSTIEMLVLGYNQLGEATYLALAAALRVNSSLAWLHLHANQAVDQAHIDAAFIEALRLNPDRPADSLWHLYSDDYFDIDYDRLKDAADELGHPSLQMLLADRLTDDSTTTLRH